MSYRHVSGVWLSDGRIRIRILPLEGPGTTLDLPASDALEIAAEIYRAIVDVQRVSEKRWPTARDALRTVRDAVSSLANLPDHERPSRAEVAGALRAARQALDRAGHLLDEESGKTVDAASEAGPDQLLREPAGGEAAP